MSKGSRRVERKGVAAKEAPVTKPAPSLLPVAGGKRAWRIPVRGSR